MLYDLCADYSIELEMTCFKRVTRKNERIEVKLKIPKFDYRMIYKVQSPSKTPKIAEKKYKYAEAEREIGHSPPHKHEATFCYSEI